MYLNLSFFLTTQVVHACLPVFYMPTSKVLQLSKKFKWWQAAINRILRPILNNSILDEDVMNWSPSVNRFEWIYLLLSKKSFTVSIDTTSSERIMSIRHKSFATHTDCPIYIVICINNWIKCQNIATFLTSSLDLVKFNYNWLIELHPSKPFIPFI